MPLFFKSPFMSFSKVLQFLMKYPFLLSLLVSILFFIPIVNGSFVPKKKKKKSKKEPFLHSLNIPYLAMRILKIGLDSIC